MHLNKQLNKQFFFYINLKKLIFRFYIQVRQFKGFDALLIWNDLNSFVGDEAASLRAVQRWCKSFKDGN